MSRTGSVCEMTFSPVLHEPSKLGASSIFHVYRDGSSVHELCCIHCPRAGPVSQAGSVNVTTWKLFSPVSRDSGIAIPDSAEPGWPGCHAIAKLIFVAFNRRAEISAKVDQPGSCNRPLISSPTIYYGIAKDEFSSR